MTKAFTTLTGIACIQCKEITSYARASEDLAFYMGEQAIPFGTLPEDWTHALCLECDIYQQGIAYDNEEADFPSDPIDVASAREERERKEKALTQDELLANWPWRQDEFTQEEVKRSAYMSMALGSSFCPPELARAEAYLQLVEGIPHELEDTDARGASEASPLLAPAFTKEQLLEAFHAGARGEQDPREEEVRYDEAWFTHLLDDEEEA